MKKIKVLIQDLSIAVILLSIVVVGSFGYGGYLLYTLNQENDLLRADIAELEHILANTEDALVESQDESDRLAEALTNEQGRLDSIKGTIAEVTDTVSDLEKLKELDTELLQKYSKVFFLNEHYVPEKITTIDEGKYLYFESEAEEIDTRIWPFLKKLLDNARNDNIDLFILSGFRSFGTQAALKSGYVFTYGAGTANQFSADQGYSEHQLGTTVDFMTTGISGTLSGFENTDAYEWLLDNAHKYGFTLSYPEGNTYYQFEPWHWRFVGEDLAKDLYNDEIHFYDMPQRAIDEYLLEIFD